VNPGEHEQVPVATAKVVAAWGGLIVGGVTLSDVALFFTIVFTVLQIYRLVRQEIRERAKAKQESEDFAAKINRPPTNSVKEP
jgi:hypothetical protein